MMFTFDVLNLNNWYILTHFWKSKELEQKTKQKTKLQGPSSVRV